MTSTPMHRARALWLRVETIHALTYFAPQSRDAAKRASLKGFWMGYFGFRAAPLGAVGAAAVEAIFFNFAPGMVGRSIPDAWEHASPSSLVEARANAAADALRAAEPDVDRVARSVVDRLAEAVGNGSPSGRPLFASNRSLPTSPDPVATMWQHCTSLREHRGDGHVATLLAAGLDGCEAHALIAAEQHIPTEILRDNRGWSPEEWAAASARLVSRSLLTPDGALSDTGHALRQRIEGETDRLAAEPLAAIELDSLLADLDPLARAITRAGILPFPNPMGLPKPDVELK